MYYSVGIGYFIRKRDICDFIGDNSLVQLLFVPLLY